MHRRGMVLAMAFSVAIVAVACGRATEEEINQALGITPTTTFTVAQIETATAQAESPATPGVLAGDIVGDVQMGQQQFTFQCGQCHRVDGSGQGPALFGADGPVANMSDEELADLIRNGTNHGDVPPFTTARVSDRQLASIVAYLRQQASS
jgi:mono/diheme cytochrome c family protein